MDLIARPGACSPDESYRCVKRQRAWARSDSLRILFALSIAALAHPPFAPHCDRACSWVAHASRTGTFHFLFVTKAIVIANDELIPSFERAFHGT
jgi:hypothetical protein